MCLGFVTNAKPYSSSGVYDTLRVESVHRGRGLKGRLQNLERVFGMMKRWTSKSPLASDVPLALNWVHQSKCRPDRFSDVLPRYVREVCSSEVCP